MTKQNVADRHSSAKSTPISPAAGGATQRHNWRYHGIMRPHMRTNVESEKPEDLPGLKFSDFIGACASGELSIERLTFEQWKRKRFRDTLQHEYNQYIIADLEQAGGDFTKLHQDGGNFYDWMTEVKGLTLTSDESELRLHQPTPQQEAKA